MGEVITIDFQGRRRVEEESPTPGDWKTRDTGTREELIEQAATTAACIEWTRMVSRNNGWADPGVPTILSDALAEVSPTDLPEVEIMSKRILDHMIELSSIVKEE